MVHTAALHDSSPIALRYPRGEGTGVAIPETRTRLEIGKGRIVRQGSKVAILSLGTRLAEALAAADTLDAKGLSTTVADMVVMNDTFRTRVEGVVYGAVLVSITPVGDDTYETTMSLDRQVVNDLRALYLGQLAARRK